MAHFLLSYRKEYKYTLLFSGMDLWVDVTSNCNRECDYCLRGDDYPRYGEEPLTYDEIIGIIANNMHIPTKVEKTHSLFSTYSKSLKSVHLSGGEPLIDEGTREGVYKIADFCKDESIGVFVYTNGDAFHDDPELLEEVYAHINSVQMGVHDYSKIGSIFNLMERKKQIEGSFTLDFIINNETKEYIPEIKRYLEAFGVENLAKSNIHIKLFDMIPLGDSIPVALTNDSTVMDDLDSYIGNLQSVDIQENITISTRDKKKCVMPSYCNTQEKAVVVDNYGYVRFCQGCYGPVFGNLKHDDMREIFLRKKKLIDIMQVYDAYSIPYKKAKELAIVKNIDYDEFSRVFCARLLCDLFEEYKIPDDLERMVSDFEEMLPDTNPPCEDHVGYNLELWQERALQIVTDSNLSSILESKYVAHILADQLPKPLVESIKKDKYYEILRNNPEEIDRGMMIDIGKSLSARERHKARIIIADATSTGLVDKYSKYINLFLDEIFEDWMSFQ